jgi:hypothetical protein
MAFALGEPMYEIFQDRDKIAQMIAAHVSGFEEAEPEGQDYALADEVVRFIDDRSQGMGDINDARP